MILKYNQCGVSTTFILILMAQLSVAMYGKIFIKYYLNFFFKASKFRRADARHEDPAYSAKYLTSVVGQWILQLLR